MMKPAILSLAALGLWACQTETAEPEVPVQPAPAEAPAAPQIAGGNVDTIDFGDYDLNLARNVGLEMGESRLDSIDKIRLYFAPEPGTPMVNLTSSTYERDDGAVMIFARNDLPDDAVFAEEIFAAFTGPGGDAKFKQSLAAFGLRVKCRRGENAMEWTTDLCP